MDAPHLKVVTPAADGDESPSDKIRRLRAEIKAAANDEIEELDDAIDHLCQIALSIADGGEAFPPGVRELCRTLAEEVAAQGKSVAVIMQRAGG